MRVQLTFAEWFRLYSIVLNTPFNNIAMERELTALADILEPTADERAAWGWTETVSPLTGATVYQLDSAKVLAWAELIEREFTAMDLNRLRVLVENPPENVPWRGIERKLKEQILVTLEVKE